MERHELTDWPGRVPGPLDALPSDPYAVARPCYTKGCSSPALDGSRWCARCHLPDAETLDLFGPAVRRAPRTSMEPGR
jgi:hypothetical protein